MAAFMRCRSRLAPYRCPPGPYERACQIASYFSKAKPKSKVLILDGNDDVTSKGPLFKKAWAERYKGIVEYRPETCADGCGCGQQYLEI
jgi:sulfide dehydrogenase [flavocytochrome c] flavoprotein subunit